MIDVVTLVVFNELEKNKKTTPVKFFFLMICHCKNTITFVAWQFTLNQTFIKVKLSVFRTIYFSVCVYLDIYLIRLYLSTNGF